jgi:hypothetical protein
VGLVLNTDQPQSPQRTLREKTKQLNFLYDTCLCASIALTGKEVSALNEIQALWPGRQTNIYSVKIFSQVFAGDIRVFLIIVLLSPVILQAHPKDL